MPPAHPATVPADAAERFAAIPCGPTGLGTSGCRIGPLTPLPDAPVPDVAAPPRQVQAPEVPEVPEARAAVAAPTVETTPRARPHTENVPLRVPGPPASLLLRSLPGSPPAPPTGARSGPP
ncbi:hypothetical protein DZF91_24535, partial [Actinomadura logoneensis]